jgi:hypothetical protein
MNYTFASTDGSKCDMVVISKDLIKNASMSAESFDELVMTFRKENTSLTDAYHKAEEVHEHYFGKPRYTDHGSYKASYSYRHNKK